MPVELLDISVSRAKSKPAPSKPEFRPRVFEDGSVEIQLAGGVRLRQRPMVCSSCGVPKVEGPLRKDVLRAREAGVCVACLLAEEAARAAAVHSRGETPAQRRYTAHVLATPIWRDRQKIKTIYDEAAYITRETGVQHEVDHIYPIQSQFGCGLHVHHNLQIIEKTRNRSKGNLFPMFDSPAGVGIV